MVVVERFSEKVYALLKQVPEGYVTTYLEIAKALNSKAYRAVGNVLNRNPYAPVVPCHRVVNSNGFIGGFANGADEKIRLLEKEGVIIKNGKVVEFQLKLFKF